MAESSGNERQLHSVQAIVKWKGLTPAERDVLIAIREHMRTRTIIGKSKGWTTTTVGQIAKWTTYSTKTVSRAVRSLRQKKVLEVKEPKSPGPGSRTNFAIHHQACCWPPKN